MKHDPNHLQAFKAAISQIAGCPNPPRSRLRQLGSELATLAGRQKPWTGGYLYNLLNLHRLRQPEKFNLNPDLLWAAVKRAGMTSANGLVDTTVRARGVRPGAVILAQSRPCGHEGCSVHFVPAVHNQRYCSAACKARVKAHRRKWPRASCASSQSIPTDEGQGNDRH